MIDPDELRKTIARRRAEQSARERTSPPDGVRIGPLISAAMDGARWRGQNAFPSSQVWSDEVERVFAFADARGQFGKYLPRLRGRWKEFGSALAELRVAFYLDRNQFRVTGWEPVGARGVRGEGEFEVTGPSGISTFVEVKSPGWEGELSEDELTGGRKNQPKHLYCEARAVAPWERVQFEVEKAYKKFIPANSNLLVIADDLFVSLQHGTDLQLGMALHEKSTKGCFTDSKYENLGAVAAFWHVCNGREIWYEMQLYVNANALKSSAIPDDMRLAFEERPTNVSSKDSGPYDDLNAIPFQRYLHDSLI